MWEQMLHVHLIRHYDSVYQLQQALVACVTKGQTSSYLFFERHMYRQSLAAAIPAVSHFAQHLTVAAAQLRVLSVMLFQKMYQRHAAVIAVCNSCNMLPDIVQNTN